MSADDVRRRFTNVEGSMSEELMAERRVEAARDAEGRVHCSCGWSAPVTRETQGGVAVAHARTHRTPSCPTCGEWLEFCGCEQIDAAEKVVADATAEVLHQLIEE